MKHDENISSGSSNWWRHGTIVDVARESLCALRMAAISRRFSHMFQKFATCRLAPSSEANVFNLSSHLYNPLCGQ